MQLHIHTNGDEATEVALDAIEAAQTVAPRPDHRHTLQHCQMADAALFRRMRALGVCVNLFANHIYLLGRCALRADDGAASAPAGWTRRGTAQRIGVPYAIHSDAPITPLDPLFTAWCAVNRTIVLRAAARQGDRGASPWRRRCAAVTLGAAYTLQARSSGRQHRGRKVRRFRGARSRSVRGRTGKAAGYRDHGARWSAATSARRRAHRARRRRQKSR